MVELGLVAPIGPGKPLSLIAKLADNERSPPAARGCLLKLAEQLGRPAPGKSSAPGQAGDAGPAERAPARTAGLRTLTPVEPELMGNDAAVTRPASGLHLSLIDYDLYRRCPGERPRVLSRDSVQRLTPPRSSGERPYALGQGVRSHEARAWGPLLLHDGSATLWHAAAQGAPERGFWRLYQLDATEDLEITSFLGSP